MILLKTNVPGLVKNTKNGYIQNTNTGQYKSIKAQRERSKLIIDLNKRLEELETRVRILETK